MTSATGEKKVDKNAETENGLVSSQLQGCEENFYSTKNPLFE
jgi:hypothetical protein